MNARQKTITARLMKTKLCGKRVEFRISVASRRVAQSQRKFLKASEIAPCLLAEYHHT